MRFHSKTCVETALGHGSGRVVAVAAIQTAGSIEDRRRRDEILVVVLKVTSE